MSAWRSDSWPLGSQSSFYLGRCVHSGGLTVACVSRPWPPASWLPSSGWSTGCRPFGMQRSTVDPEPAAGLCASGALLRRAIPSTGERLPGSRAWHRVCFDSDNEATRQNAVVVLQALIAGGGSLVDTSSVLWRCRGRAPRFRRRLHGQRRAAAARFTCGPSSTASSPTAHRPTPVPARCVTRGESKTNLTCDVAY